MFALRCQVTGTPENADQARREIESHIALRTGGGLVDGPPNLNLNHAAPAAPEDALNQLNDFHSNGVDAGLSNGDLVHHHHHNNSDFYGSMYSNKNLLGNQPPLPGNKGGTPSAFSAYNSNNLTSSSTSSVLSNQRHQLSNHQHQNSIFTFPPTGFHGNNSTTGVGLGNHHHHHHHHSSSSSHSNGFISNGYGMYDNSSSSPLDTDDAALTSPVFGDVGPGSLSLGGSSVWSDVAGDVPAPPPHHLPPHHQQLPVFTTGTTLPMRSHSYGAATPRLSPILTDSHAAAAAAGIPGLRRLATPPPHAGHLRRIGSDPLTSGGPGLSTGGSGSPTLSSNSSSSGSSFGPALSMVSLSAESASSSPTDSSGGLGAALRAGAGSARPRACMVCGDGDSVAAFVPCGHNLFCMDCAKGIMDGPELDRRCPVCQMLPSQAIQIHH